MGEKLQKIECQFEYIFISVKSTERFKVNTKSWHSTSALYPRSVRQIYEDLMCLPQVHYVNMPLPTSAKFWE